MAKDKVRDDDIDDEGNIDVEWYPVPKWLEAAWDEVENERGIEEERMLESKDKKYKVDGKKGVWRTVGGAKVFFPDDGSQPIGAKGVVDKITGGDEEDDAPTPRVKSAERPKKSKAKKEKPPYEMDDDDSGQDEESPDKVAKKVRDSKGRFIKKNKGSGEEAMGDLDDEDSETADDVEGGKKVKKGRARRLVTNLVSRSVTGGLGVALLSVFPGIVGYALSAIIMKKAAAYMWDSLKSLTESKGKKVDLAKMVEREIERALDDVQKGKFSDAEYAKAMSRGKRKSAKKESLNTGRGKLLSEYAMAHAVKTKELPDTIKKVLKKLKFHRREIDIIPSATASLGSAGGKGYRSFAVVLNVGTGKHEITYGSWGGPNMFAKNNPVDNSRKEYRIPRNGAVITGHEGGGRPVYAVIHVNPEMVAGFLPTKPDISDLQAKILEIYSKETSASRWDSIRRAGGSGHEVDLLVQGGFLNRNANGAIQITLKGKNAAKGR